MNFKNTFINSNLPEVLSKEELRECFEKINSGDEIAKKKVIEHNLRYVCNLVFKKYLNTGVPPEDLVSIGSIGLIKSVNTFDINKGVEFITYASRCIENEILMFLRNEKKHGNVRSFEELIIQDKNGKELVLEDILADENSDFVSDFEIAEEYILIRRAVQKLPEKEKNIIEMYFGLNGNKPCTCKEIAQRLNVSRSYASRLISNILPKVKKQFLKEKPIIYRFDIKDIHPLMTKDVFFLLLSLFPERDIQEYSKYRKLSITSKTILINGANECYSSEYINYMSIIEQELCKMFEYYQQLIEKNIEYDIIISKVKNWIIKRSIRFRYPEQSLDLLLQYVKRLPENLKNTIILRHGEALLNYNEFPKDKTCYNQYLYLAYKKIDNFIERDILKHPNEKSLVVKYSDMSFGQLNEYVKKLPQKYANVIYLRHGKMLDDYCKFPSDKSYQTYYKLYIDAVQMLNDLIKGVDAVKVERNKKSLLSVFSKEDLLYAVPKLKSSDQNVVYLRHGKEFNVTIKIPSAPSDKHPNYYEQKYYNVFNKIEKILAEREEKKKNDPFINKLGDYTFDEVIEGIEVLIPEERKIVYLRHGKLLDEFNPYPSNMPFSYYKNLYNSAIYNLKNVLKEKKYPELYEKEKNRIETLRRNRELEREQRKEKRMTKSIIQLETKENILWAMQYLSETQKNVLLLRHGEGLDKTLPWPKVPEGKNNNYYYSNYHNMCKSIKNIIQNREVYEKQGLVKRKYIKNKRNSIIDKIEHDILVETVKLLSEKHRNVMYLRHGENLDQVLPWPDVPEGKYDNYYYVNYSNAVKKINSFLQEKKSAVLKQNESTKTEDVNTSKKPKTKSKKQKETSSEEKRQGFIETKSQLEQMKLQNFAASLYDKYGTLYGGIIKEEEMELIIRNAIDSYSYDEGLSLELSASFKIENTILLKLANIYKQDPNSEESLEILLLIEEIFGNKIRARYTNTFYETPYCYVSDELILQAVEQTLLNYTGRSTFYTEVSLKVKKLYR